MENKAIETARDAGIQLAHLTGEISRTRKLVEDVVKDKKRQAQRALKRGYVTAEETVEDTTYYIKHHPWKSVGIAAGVGAFAGLIFGWSWSRNGRA